MIIDFPNLRGFSVDFLEIVKEFWDVFLAEVEFHVDIFGRRQRYKKWDFQEKIILQFIFSPAVLLDVPAALFELCSASLRCRVPKIATQYTYF